MKQLLGLIVIVGAIAAYFWWIVAIAAVCGAAWLIARALRGAEENAAVQAATNAAIAARADQQHSWALAGDSRGTFGEIYTPLP